MSPAAGAARTTAVRTGGALAALAVSWGIWRALMRWWFPQADDFLFTSMGNGKGITFSFAEWSGAVSDDWFHRNGRLADGLLRAILRPGFDTFRWVAPVFITAFGLGLAWSWARGRRERLVDMLPLGLLTLPGLLALWPEQTGDVVFWAAGHVNYLVPVPGILLVATTLAQLARGDRPGAPMLVLGILAAPTTAVLHEQASLAVLAMALTAVVAARGRLPRGAWCLVTACLAGSALQISAPGLWSRTASIDASSPTSWEQRLHACVSTAGTLISHATVLWWSVLALLVVAVAREGHRRLGMCAVASLAALLLQLASLPAQASMSRRGATLALCVVALLLVWTLLIATRRVETAVVWAAMGAAWLPCLALGIGGARAQFIPLTMLACVLGQLVVDQVAATDPAAVRTPLLGLLVLASLLWWGNARVQLQDNARWFHSQVEAPLRAASNARVKAGTVELPQRPPHPEYSYRLPTDPGRYADSLRKYYGISPTVIVKAAMR